MVNYTEMWKTVQGNPSYLAKLQEVSRRTNVPLETLVVVLETYFDVSLELSDEAIAERKAQELLEQ